MFGQTEILKLNNYITDYAKIFNTQQKSSLENHLKKIEESSKIQIVLVTIDKIEGYTIEEYTIAVAEKNKIGTKDIDNGVIILFNMSAKEVRIEVGYGLEGILTDLKCAQIIREQIIPNFKNGDYYQGINLAINEIKSLNNINVAHSIFTTEDKEKIVKNEVVKQENKSTPSSFGQLFWYLMLIPLTLGVVLSFYTYKEIKEYRLLFTKI
jgi:uncharacterized membrane protein YgcG